MSGIVSPPISPRPSRPVARHIARFVIIALVPLVMLAAISRGGSSNTSSKTASVATATAATSTPTASPASASSPAPSATPGTTAGSPSGVSAQGTGQTATAQTGVVDQNAISRVAASSKPGIVQITDEEQSLRAGGAVVPAGVGTGFVLDDQGHILTNDHVVARAQQLEVQSTDGKSFPAIVVGRDPNTDLAVIQVQGQQLPVLPLGDSSQLAVGQWVVAIGNALALPGGPTVTQGVVSALGRTVQEPGDDSGGGRGSRGGAP